jgi:hypothetical protein
MAFLFCFYHCRITRMLVMLKHMRLLFIEGQWSQNNLDNGADLLIPVPPLFCGVLIIEEETIVCCSANVFRAILIKHVGHWWNSSCYYALLVNFWTCKFDFYVFMTFFPWFALLVYHQSIWKGWCWWF